MNQNQVKNQKPTKFHSLSRKIVRQFCLFTLFISTVYGIFCFMLMYSLEDDFIEREVRNEANIYSKVLIKITIGQNLD